MKLSDSSPLFMSEVYDYDIPSCHYQILKNINYDLSDIPEHDKETRNIKIGLIMRDNPDLAKYLRETTISTIDEYLKINEIKESDIILRQYDGILLRKPMVNLNSLELEIILKNYYNKFLISIQRDMYIAKSDTQNVFKGIPNLYNEMEKFLNKILEINYANICSIALSLKNLKQEFFNGNIKLFFIPFKKNRFKVFMKELGPIEVGETIIKLEMMELKQIDIEKYFDTYISPFFQSIVYYFY